MVLSNISTHSACLAEIAKHKPVASDCHRIVKRIENEQRDAFVVMKKRNDVFETTPPGSFPSGVSLGHRRLNDNVHAIMVCGGEFNGLPERDILHPLKLGAA